MDATGLSLAARALRDRLISGLSGQVGQVLIGHPQAAGKAATSGSTTPHTLNLFFYRVDSGAFPSAGSPRDPLYLRAQCLITPFADADSNVTTGASAGENDLRLIGLVAQVLHEHPQLDLFDASQNLLVARLQVVPVPLTLDDINHLWATQSDTPFRLSLAYELALLPLPLARPVARAPLVGAVALQVSAGRHADGDQPTALPFSLPALAVDVRAPDWTPQIAWADSAHGLQLALALPRGTTPATVRLVCAGQPGAVLDLVWSCWTAADGWAPFDPEPTPGTASADAARIDAGQTVAGTTVVLPATPPPQLQLHAQRRRPGRVLRSNPLLLSFYAGASP